MSKPKATRLAFGEYLVRLGEKNPSIVVLDADLSKSTQSQLFAQKFPERFYEMGIAEANMIGTGAGMALSGLRPFICSFGCFVTGRFDQIRMSIGYSQAPVTIVGTHSGVGIGEDGHSQMGLEDVAIMRVIPNMRVVQPCDETETHSAMDAILAQNDPVYFRLTRQNLRPVLPQGSKFVWGEANVLNQGKDAVLLTSGALTQEGVDACAKLASRGVSLTHLNVGSIKPLKPESICDWIKPGQWVITAEDHYVEGGLGGAVAELLSTHKPTRLHRIGVEGRCGQSGTPEENYREYGFTSDALAERIHQLLSRL